jgi:selenocysteine lyase/cysteine desulfurase
MGSVSPGVSRRHFLRGSVAAIGALSAGPFAPRLKAETVRSRAGLPHSGFRPKGPPDEAYWRIIRTHFNLKDGLTFMNNGTLGPTPRIVNEAMERYLRELAEDPTDASRREDVEVVREHVARFVGASPDEIILTRSTTEGMNIFAHGLDWREGDEVLMCSHEHRGGWGAYRTLEERRSIKVNVIDLPSAPDSADQIVSLYENAITPRTRLIMVSHVTYVTGLVTPVQQLSEMAHRRGVLVSVDGAHPLGMMELNLHDLGCDHYAASGQKWLLAGTGTGVCYIRRDLQEQVWQLMSYPNEERPAAREYEEVGQRNMPSLLAMTAAVEFQNAIGKQNIEMRVRELATRLMRGLQEIPGVKLWTPMDPTLCCGLTLFSVRDIPMENVQQAIMERDHIYIRTMTTGGLNACRASTHFYNMPEEVDRLVGSVRHL